MQTKSLKIPAIIFVTAIVLCLAACFLAGMIKAPTVTEHDFPYAATYQLNGETKTLEGVYRVCFRSAGEGTNPRERYYEGFCLEDPDGRHTIAEQDGLQLRIVFLFNDSYLMGDGDRGETYGYAIPDPYLAAYDDMGVEYTDMETLEKFGAELVSWETPQPIENTFVFSEFVLLHQDSMTLMLLVGILAIIACMLFVKRDKTIPYTTLDKVSTVFNFLVVLVALPFMTLVVSLMPIYVSGDEIIYKLDLCVPVITALSVAASLSLRRKHYSVAGFCVQFIGPVLFVVLAVLESILPV